LIPASGSVEGIELVRAKFDPLAKKLPAHVTLLFPEPADKMGKDFLKEFTSAELPKLDAITFSSMIVHEDMYLWLVPDEESKEKMTLWRQALVQKLGEHTQDEEFTPHLTLGYIPRSITPDDALAFAKIHVTLPLTLPLDKIMLEEFAENQISTQLDSLSLNPQNSQ
jgi:2'-5' RNA ligase